MLSSETLEEGTEVFLGVTAAGVTLVGVTSGVTSAATE